ncbi:hypothetical protein [Arhodomonas sp. AD133]|uniref:hypothetical protein n=1 Tax=Arhodomonas sp. AD133 TaxID=3415009 RepID=UPI003EBC0454
MKKLVFVGSLLVSAAAVSEPVEVWECKDKYGRWDDILVEAHVDQDRRGGSISVAGVTHPAQFEVAGFDRRWDFGLDSDSTFKYAFIIKPNGDASYYDFSSGDKAKPSNFMKCRQKAVGNAN